MRKKRDIFMKFLVLMYGILVIAFLAQTPFLNAEDYTEDQSGFAPCLGIDQAERLEANACLEAIRTSSLPPGWSPDTLEENLCEQNTN